MFWSVTIIRELVLEPS